MKAAAIIYILWAVFLIGSGIYIMRHMTDKSNPSSLSSSFKKLEDTLHADPEVP